MEIPAGASPPEGAPVQTWDPPHRLVIRMESPDGTFNALDYAIEARDNGTAHLCYVHSGILADEWEDQYDAIDGIPGALWGWEGASSAFGGRRPDLSRGDDDVGG